MKRKGELIVNPAPDILLPPGDEPVLIGTARSEKRFVEKYPAAA